MGELSVLNRSMAAAATLADALEEQIGPAFMTRVRLVAWVLDQFEDTESLEKAVQALPQLPPQLYLDYECFRGHMI